MHELKWHNVTLEHNFTSVQEKGRMLIVSQRSVIRAQVRPDGVTSGASHRWARVAVDCCWETRYSYSQTISAVQTEAVHGQSSYQQPVNLSAADFGLTERIPHVTHLDPGKNQQNRDREWGWAPDNVSRWSSGTDSDRIRIESATPTLWESAVFD